ncbi:MULTISPECIES: terminase small subunit [Providencia]|uniref:terminase small subunit n=1 Tax=Providencia TaxID=586 RepID=UPI002066D00D|nr:MULTISPECIES: terminase small subunit [Providencia]UPS61659.1 terminase small subunit [Providencia rettgeri]WOC01158.1 terminase small subunit [Providencia sp. PROV046]
MAKLDWGTLQQQFLTEHAISGISPKEWCEDQGLNYATARRYIKKPAAQSAQKTAQKKLRTAHEKECAKEPIHDSDIPTAQSSEQDSAHDDESAFNLRNYGLNDMQFRFVNEYLVDLNRTAAYKRAGGNGEGNTAYVGASRMYRNAKVNRAITDALADRERRTQITQDAVLKMWWDIATADVNELTEYRRLCCRHCWGFGFNYQWRDAVEYEDAVKKATAASKPPPQDVGGYGYDDTLDPNPDCPRCNGTGIGRAHFHDTRDLTGAARRLFAGVKEGKFGVEVITRNQDDALKMVAQHLGMVKTRTEVTGADGGPIQSTGIDLSHLSFEQLMQLRKKSKS